MNPLVSFLWRSSAALLALAGIAGFIWLFARDMNVYWFILSPLILAVYEIPAVVVYALWKKARRREAPKEESRSE
ncbi:MAG: hypothetical protein FJY82_10990 [Candidatus Aminicenantes bacterium]|nr:hypothetical protein [Candidatus Aminicenantes bacterium]